MSMWQESTNSSHALTLKLEAYGDDSTASLSSGESNETEGEYENGSPNLLCNRKRKRSEEENERDSEESENTESDMPEVVHQMEAEIERQLDAKAKKSNLTVANVKNIIKNVITNEHVLELVRRTMQQPESNFCVNTVLSLTPKLTRSKTKELLNTFPSIAWPLTQNKTVSNSECKVLIEEDLPEDSSDEEYRPEDDQDEVENLKSESDIYNDCDDEEEQDESDDGENCDDDAEDDIEEEEEEESEILKNNGNKKTDLCHNLPFKHNKCIRSNDMKYGGKIGNLNDDDDDDEDDDDECRLVICDDDYDDCKSEKCDNNCESKVGHDKDDNAESLSHIKTALKEDVHETGIDMLSKFSQDIGDKKHLNSATTKYVDDQSICEENICQRTRSKLCLSDTPLEIIESAFMPPDITTDMYDSECDDENWKNFLKGFTEPLKPNLLDAPDDDDEETDPEYNVMAEEEETEDKEELREDPDVMVSHREVQALMAELFEYNGMLFDDFDSRKKSNFRENGNIFQNKYSSDELDDIAQQIAGALEPHSDEAEMEESSSMPTHSGKKSAVLDDIIHPANFSSSMKCVNGPLSNSSCPLENVDPCKTRKLIFNKPPVDPTKMSHEQKMLLDQQLRKHVQLLTQHFLLAYLHPMFHVYAMDCQQYLRILKLLSKNDVTSTFYIENLDESFTVLEKWEELYESEEAKNKYNTFFENEIDCQRNMKKKKQPYGGKFPPEFAEIVVNSKVFLYPSLLPTSPFRCDPYNTFRFFPSEDNLISLGLELFMNLSKDNSKVWGEATLYKIVPMIVQHLTPVRKESTVYNHILECSKSVEYSPIKYYLENKKAPRTIHYVIPYGLLHPPKKMPFTLLPDLWKNFVTTKECQ